MQLQHEYQFDLANIRRLAAGPTPERLDPQAIVEAILAVGERIERLVNEGLVVLVEKE